MSIRTKSEARAYRTKLEGLITTASDTAAIGAVEIFPSWQTGASYAVGDRIRDGDMLYRCLQAHTSQADWSPGAAASLWTAIADPAVEWPEWVQPTGAQDAYASGAKVSHGGKHWTSTADANVWEPGVYGWTQ